MKQISVLKAPSTITEVVFSPNGKYTLIGTDRNRIILWDLSLPNLSFKQLVLILKLNKLKLSGKELNTLFDFPEYKEIFDDIANKDEILGELAKDLELDCVICFEKLDNDRTKLKCGHNQFHFVCIEQWKEIQENAKCPICRKDLNS